MDDILKERPIMQRRLNVDKQEFYSCLTEYTYAEIVDNLCKLIFKKKGKHAWGDKTPHYIFNLEIIYELFPESKYIYIVRDGRDVALSLLREPWGPNNFVTCGIYWRKANSHPLLSVLQEEGRVYKVKYEDLLGNPLKVVGDMYKFLEVEIPEDKLQKIVEPINANNFDKWKREMSSGQIDLFERTARSVLIANGYQVSSGEGSLSLIEMLWWKAHNLFFRFLHLVKINTVDWFLIKFFKKEPFAS